MRNNSQSSFDASNIPHSDPNRSTPTISPNKMPRFGQVDPALTRSIQRDDMGLHELLKASNDDLNCMLTSLIIPNPNPNPTTPWNQPIIFKKGLTLTPLIIPSPDPNPYPVRRIDTPRLGSNEKVVFEQPCMTVPPPPLPRHYQPTSCSSIDDTAINRTGLLSDLVNSCSKNEIHLAATSLPRIPLSSNGAVVATQGKVNLLDRKNRWSHHEHNLLLVGMEIYGKGEWKKIANNVIITKTYKQVASHAQKYFERKGKKSKRASIHDTDTVDRRLLSQVRARLGLSYS